MRARDMPCADSQDRVPLHVPVMLNEAIELLDVQPGKVILDATVGLGGHAKAIVQQLMPGVLVKKSAHGNAPNSGTHIWQMQPSTH